MPELAGLPDLRVAGLPDDQACTLLASAHPGPVDARVLERIVAESQGNPLALLELPRGFTPDELAGGFGLLSSTAPPRRIKESFRRQIATLSPTMRQVLLVAAAEPVGDPVLVWRAVDRLGLSLKAAGLQSAEAAGLVEFASRVRFRHPLLRSVIYNAASAKQRRCAHAALAEVVDPVADPDRRAWHLAQATGEPDEFVAAELERCAGRAQARGGLPAAAAFLERASELTPDPAHRGRRALDAAKTRYLAGMPEASSRLLALAKAGPLGALGSAEADLLRARLAFAASRQADAALLLLKAATQLQSLDLALARDTYLEALQAGWFTAHVATGPNLRDLSAAARAAPSLAPPPRPSDVLLDGLATRYGEGYPAGAPLLKQALNEFTSPQLSEDVGLRWLWLACTSAFDLWEDETCELLTSRFVKLAQDSGTLARLPMALTIRAFRHVFTGDLGAASRLLQEFDAVLEATGLYESPYAAQLLAVWRGQEERAGALIAATTADATARGEGIGLIAAGWMQALLCNSLGCYDQALMAAREATEPRQEMGLVTWCSLVELITAAARTGNADIASDAFARLEPMTQASGSDWALGLQARCQAMISDGESAEAHYRNAIDHLARTRIRGEVARTHLHYGEWLRRHNRRYDARDQLRTAHDMFTTMGMDAFTVLAARELGATGETVRRRVDASSAQLTAHEAQIVRLVRDELSNAEIATRLFISPRTVEWHLSKIFAKLGVSSRRQLRR